MKPKMLLICDLRSPWVRGFIGSLSQNFDLYVLDVQTSLDSYLFNADSEINKFINKYNNINFKKIFSISLLDKIKSIFTINHYIYKHQINHSMSIYNGYFGFLHLFLNTQIKLGYWVGSDINKASKVKKWLNKFLLNHFYLNLFNGEPLLDIANLISDKNKNHLFLMGLDLEEFVINNSIPNKEKIILCTRGFEPVYNNRFILDVFSKIDLIKIGYKLVFTSKGSQLDELIKYSDQIYSEEQRKQVVFLKGCERTIMVRYYFLSEFYISASLSDGASISLWEAMLAKSYPILSNIDANKYWERVGSCTLFDFDVESFINNFNSVIYKDKIEALESNYEYVIDNLNINDVSSKLFSVLRS